MNEQEQDQAKETYMAAVRELFRLLETPRDKQAEDHKRLLMEANDACGRARVAMLGTFEGSTRWPR
jgi:hypothetical protein